MRREFTLSVNGRAHSLEVDGDTPLLYILRDDLGLKGVKLGCGSEQCGACKVLVDGQAVPTCKLPVEQVQGLAITTIEGLGGINNLHPLQEAFIEEQALQCGYCTAGMILSAQGLLNRQRYPNDGEIRAALDDNLCRCGVYDRVRRAIKLRIGHPDTNPNWEILSGVEPTSTQGKNLPARPLPYSLTQNPNLDSWVRINPDETITLFTGKVEYGQGIKTAIAQIGAEELDVSLERIRIATTDTDHSPDEGLTVGSMSLETTGEAIRQATAEARHFLLSIAYEELEAPLERLAISDGTITDPVSGRSTTYWKLLAGRSFGRQVTGMQQPKSPDKYALLGQGAKRLDLNEKVSGAFTYLHDLDLPGMVHGRVLRPPHYAARLVSVDLAAAEGMPGVLKVVKDGSFLAVVTKREEQAVAAIETLRESASWDGEQNFPPQDRLDEHMLSQPVDPYLVVDGMPVHDPLPAISAPDEAAHTLKATYFRPYQMHASLGPSAAAALIVDGKLTLWVQSQGVYPIRAAVGHVLGIAEQDIRVIHVEGAGCYGHNGADDAALDAALLAVEIPGRPVLLKWTREDEHGWEPYGPAMVVKMQASLGADGMVTDWNHDVWSYPHLGRAQSGGDSSGLLAAWYLAEPFERGHLRPELAPHVGGHRNADPLYAFPQKRIAKHLIPNSPLRVSALRSLGAYGNVFAIESFMDELAYTAGVDPVQYRLDHLEDKRAQAVIRAAAEKAGWVQREKNDGQGQGIAFAQYKNRQCYAAVIVDLHVDRNSGQIHLERAVIAADAGQIVNPDGLSNQLEGGFVQAASWTLNEEVTFNQEEITSRDWDSYSIMRFPNSPKIETVLINRPGMPFLGSGEAAIGPTPAAVANAINDAVGVRLREIPFAPERVRATLNEN